MRSIYSQFFEKKDLLIHLTKYDSTGVLYLYDIVADKKLNKQKTL